MMSLVWNLVWSMSRILSAKIIFSLEKEKRGFIPPHIFFFGGVGVSWDNSCESDANAHLNDAHFNVGTGVHMGCLQ